MNILQILPELNVGGVETGTVDLAKYLVLEGHKSVVVSNGGTLTAELESHGSRHYHLPVHEKNFLSMFFCVPRLVKIIRDEKIDIVHARSRVPAWIAYFACRQTQAQFMTTCHGYYTAHLFSQVMGWGKITIAISEIIARHMVQDFKTPAANIRVIARSVDLAKFNLPRPPKTDAKILNVVMIGRITPLKGHEFFLRAMARVIHHLPAVRVQIVGDAPAKKQVYKEELVLLARRLGILERVEFMGNRRDVPEILSRADCLVLATITQEAFGRVVIEAQAAGVPVVATRVGGVTEIIDDGKTGLLVLPKDPEAMADAVIRVLKDPELVARFNQNAIKKIHERYTLPRMAESTINVYKELVQSSSILIIKLTAVGDVVLSTAAFKAIRAQFPEARIFCLTSPQASSIVEACPFINEVIVYDPKQKGIKSLWDMARELRRYQFDKIIDLQNNRLSHLLSFLAFPKKSYGYDNGKFGFLLTDRIKNNVRNIPPVEHQFRILKMLDIPYAPDLFLELKPSSKDEATVQALLDSEWLNSSHRFVGVNISASKNWPTKNWPMAHMVKLCDILGSKNIRVILTGEEKDKPLAREIIAQARAKPASFAGKTTILQLAALIKRCDAYISPDSAPLHVAAGMNVPLIALFGPTDPRRHMPPASKAVIFNKALKCSPCYAGICKIQTHACMREILPEEVARKVMSFIK